MLFAPLFSGSSGNATYIGTREEGVFIDAGVSGIRILRELERAGIHTGAVRAILVTHAHNDHTNGVGVLSRKLQIPVYATEGTWAEMEGKLGRIDPMERCILRPGEDFFLAGLNIMPFAIPHDAAEPVGYALNCGRMKVAIATDIGRIENGWIDAVAGANLVLLEANHNREMLQAGPYPYELKRRILSTRGHLCNEDAAKAAVILAKRGSRRIILGHLSKENNFPKLAWQTVAGALAEEGWLVGEDLHLDVARSDGLTAVYRLEMEDAAI